MQELTMEEVLIQAKESLDHLKEESNNALSGGESWSPDSLLQAQSDVLESFDQIQSAMEKAKDQNRE